mmetsp:Transcript_50321/g.151534  ORF Transcript_50321/g.151534 Transcript_50321/m.151534 type:complete len:315 (-) Transcript_50321:698-1642(-)
MGLLLERGLDVVVRLPPHSSAPYPVVVAVAVRVVVGSAPVRAVGPVAIVVVVVGVAAPPSPLVVLLLIGVGPSESLHLRIAAIAPGIEAVVVRIHVLHLPSDSFLRGGTGRIPQLEILVLLVNGVIRIFEQGTEAGILEHILGDGGRSTLGFLLAAQRLVLQSFAQVRIDLGLLLPVALGSDAAGPLLLQLFPNLLLSIFFVLERIGDRFDTIVQPDVDEEAVHISPQQRRADKIGHSHLVDFGPREEFVIPVHLSRLLPAQSCAAAGAAGLGGGQILLFEFLRDPVQERAPSGRRAECGYVERLHLGLFSRAQ